MTAPTRLGSLLDDLQFGGRTLKQAQEWMPAEHLEIFGHAFIQDESDIPGGCSSCWANLEGIDNED